MPISDTPTLSIDAQTAVATAAPELPNFKETDNCYGSWRCNTSFGTSRNCQNGPASRAFFQWPSWSVENCYAIPKVTQT